jgi:hypothetical protein
MRRQAIAQRTEARWQHINREGARLAELQYIMDILRQQERCQQPNANPPLPNHPIPPSPPPFNDIRHNQPPSPPHKKILQPPPLPPNHFFHHPPPPPQISTADPKSSLAEHLHLAPWPMHYRAVPPPKYHGNTDPRKFVMCYESAIASVRGDEATLVKSLIISLEDATDNS